MQEQGFVTDPPHIYIRRAGSFAGMHLQVIDIIQYALEIAKFRVPSQKIMFAVVSKIVNDSMLLYCFRVPAGEFK